VLEIIATWKLPRDLPLHEQYAMTKGILKQAGDSCRYKSRKKNFLWNNHGDQSAVKMTNRPICSCFAKCWERSNKI